MSSKLSQYETQVKLQTLRWSNHRPKRSFAIPKYRNGQNDSAGDGMAPQGE